MVEVICVKRENMLVKFVFKMVVVNIEIFEGFNNIGDIFEGSFYELEVVSELVDFKVMVIEGYKV